MVLSGADRKILTMSLRQASMIDLEAMKEAAWENVHGGVDWEPIVEGFDKTIQQRLELHDRIINDELAEAEPDRPRYEPMSEMENGNRVRRYRQDIISELKTATRDGGRPHHLHVVK